MDLSKGFDCIPHEILIAKKDVYGFSENAITFFFSYLKRGKQSFKLTSHIVFFNYSYLVICKAQFPVQFSLLYGLFMDIKNSDLHNFADDNTISCVSSSLNKLISELEKEGSIATQLLIQKSFKQ